jgi:hypothetical protein
VRVGGEGVDEGALSRVEGSAGDGFESVEGGEDRGGVRDTGREWGDGAGGGQEVVLGVEDSAAGVAGGGVGLEHRLAIVAA